MLRLYFEFYVCIKFVSTFGHGDYVVLLYVFIWFLVSKLLFEKLAFVCSFDFQLFSNGFQLSSSNFNTFFLCITTYIHYTPWSSHCTLSHHLIVCMATETIRHIEMWNIFNVERYILMHLSSVKRQLCR